MLREKSEYLKKLTAEQKVNLESLESEIERLKQLKEIGSDVNETNLNVLTTSCVFLNSSYRRNTEDESVTRTVFDDFEST